MPNYQLDNIADDEIHLSDILNFFSDAWRTLVFCSAATGLLGLAFSFLMSPQYKGRVIIQAGKVANAEIEPASILLQRLQMPTYYSATTLRACGVQDDESELLAKKLTPTLGKNTTLVSFTVQGASVANVRLCLEKVLETIGADQQASFQSVLQLKQSQLDSLRRRLAAAEATLSAEPAKFKQAELAQSRFTDSSLLFALLSAKAAEAKELRAQVSELELNLLPPQTSAVRFATPIHAPAEPVGLSKVALVLIAALLGAGLATAYLLLRRAWVKALRAPSALPAA